MRLSFTKRMMVISVIDTKNPDYKNYNLVAVDDRSPDVVTVFGNVLPIEPGKVYTLEMGLSFEKKTVTEAGERKKYDIGKLYINRVVQDGK